MFLLSKKGSVSLQIGIGLLLAIISQSDALKCYKCFQKECRQDDIPVIDCPDDQNYVCFIKLPDQYGLGEERKCLLFPAEKSMGCSGGFCTCSEDLCNAREFGEPKPGQVAASAVPSATPLLIILGSLITVAGGVLVK